MKVGILGLPGSGKTTLWCLLCGATEGPDPRQVGKIQTRTVKVHDPRLERLRDDYKPAKYTPATVEICDFPGAALEKHPQDRAGLAQLLAPARNMDVLIVVLRDFDPSPGDKVDALNDWQEIQTELLLADLSVVEKRVEKLRVRVKKPTPTRDQELGELELLERLLKHLESERRLGDFSLAQGEQKSLSGFGFLSGKPMVAVLNRRELPVPSDRLAGLEKELGLGVFAVAAQSELEILQLSPEDQEAFRKEFAIEVGTPERIIAECYRAAALISFFTVGEKEVRAWTIHASDNALAAAGAIHSDMARGFIRAETVSYDDYIQYGGIKGAKEKGHFRLEGKDYLVQDGDLILFRFST